MVRETTTVPMLSQRALNRALLDRQMLLERAERSVPDAVRDLYGLQAQAPWSPYTALWSRLAGFDPHELGAMLTDRRAVRIVIMRGTVHLLAADDALALRPLHAQFLARSLATSNWQAGLSGLDLPAVAAAGRALVEQAPRPFGELGRLLSEQCPDRDPATLAQVVRGLAPLVQVPPRAVWGRSGQVIVTTLEHWAGRPLDAAATLDDMVLRYLAVYGPASVMDIQAWSGLTRLREVVDRLGDRVVRFRNEGGRELLDLPDAPRPDPDVPAPVRFLPDFDNVSLSHATAAPRRRPRPQAADAGQRPAPGHRPRRRPGRSPLVHRPLRGGRHADRRPVPCPGARGGGRGRGRRPRPSRLRGRRGGRPRRGGGAARSVTTSRHPSGGGGRGATRPGPA